MKLQDAQDTINFYLEQSPEPTSKKPVALLGAPGLNPVLSLFPDGSGPGALGPYQEDKQALYIVASTVFLITISAQATATSPAQFAANPVGTLLTSVGPVAIRDNGVLSLGKGGYALIVDGPYAYYYLLSGTTYIN